MHSCNHTCGFCHLYISLLLWTCAIFLLYQTYPASPTRNNQRKPVLAHVCPLVRPTQGGQTDARCPWLAHRNFSLAETTSYASPRSTSVLYCLPYRRLFDPPKPKVYNSYSVQLFLYFLVSFSSCIFLSPSSVPYASRTCLDYFPTKVTGRCKPLHTYSANGFQSGGFRCTLTSLELTRRSRYM